METIEGIKTEFGVLSGRDAIFLDSILHSSDTILTPSGKIEVDSISKSFQIQFTGILFQQMIECDFDERNSIVSFV